MKELFFISKDARWQKYRNDVLTALALKHNYSITILTNGPVESFLRDSPLVRYKIFSSWLPDSWKISFFPGALLYTIRKKPSCVLAISNSSQLTEYLGLLLCKIFSLRFVFWTHAYDHGSRPNGFFLKFFDSIRVRYMESCLRMADRIITFSEKGKHYLVSRKIKNESAIFSAPNTLDTNRLFSIKNNISQTRAELRKEQRIPEDHFVMLFVGRIYKDKNLINALKAIEISTNKNSKITFVIIGEGAEKQNLRSYVEKNKMINVHFKEPILDDEESAKWFSLADVFMIPGAIGLAIVHAFVFGLPVITEIGKAHGPELQFLKDKENGFLVAENDIPTLAEKVLFLMNNPLILKSMSEKAKETARKEAGIDSSIDAMNKAIAN